MGAELYGPFFSFSSSPAASSSTLYSEIKTTNQHGVDTRPFTPYGEDEEATLANRLH